MPISSLFQRNANVKIMAKIVNRYAVYLKTASNQNLFDVDFEIRTCHPKVAGSINPKYLVSAFDAIKSIK
jgi:hypothetical protein